MSASGSMDDFAAMFRAEHRAIRDVLLDLIDAARSDDRLEAGRLVSRLSRLSGPHFRYEEERMYPALLVFFGLDHLEGLCEEHDAAIRALRRLSELVRQEAGVGWDRAEAERLARGLLPHVSDCEGLSIMVERLPEREIARILAARRRAWEDDLDLLTWAAEGRVRHPAEAG